MFDWLKSLFEGQEEEIQYKGFLIRPGPSKIARVYGSLEQIAARQGKWSLQLFIRKESDEFSEERCFQAFNVYKTKREAIRHCIEYGKQKIDAGEVADL